MPFDFMRIENLRKIVYAMALSNGCSSCFSLILFLTGAQRCQFVPLGGDPPGDCPILGSKGGEFFPAGIEIGEKVSPMEIWEWGRDHTPVSAGTSS
jgi:hypothetical protein